MKNEEKWIARAEWEIVIWDFSSENSSDPTNVQDGLGWTRQTFVRSDLLDIVISS